MPDGVEQEGATFKVTVTDVADKEVDPQLEERLRSEGRREAGEPSGLGAAIWLAFLKLLEYIAETAVELLDFFLSKFAVIILRAQGERTPEFYEMVAAIMTDLTGVSVDPAQLQAAFAQRGRVGAMQATGASLFNLLASEFLGTQQVAGERGFEVAPGGGIGGLPTGELTPEQGIKAAQAFLGFVLSFAVRQGNVEVLTDTKYLPFIDKIPEFGAQMAQNLGLSRLTRLLMRPLFQTAVGTPLTWALNLQYRPTALTPSEATRAWLSQAFTAEQLRDELRKAGYTEEKISALIDQNIKSLSTDQLRNLFTVGDLIENDYRLLLRRAGYSEEMVDLLFKAEEAAQYRLASLNAATVVFREVLDGEVTPEEYADMLSRIALTPAERTRLTTILGELLHLPRKTLTLRQMSDAFISGTVDLAEFEDYLVRVGYREDDRKILVIQMLLRLAKQAEAEKLKAERAAAKAAKAKPPAKSSKPPSGGAAPAP